MHRLLQLFERLGKHLEEALEAAGRWCKASAEELRKRSRASLLAAGGLELQGKLEKEFQRIDAGFSERLGHYSGLHRRLDDLLQRLEADYQASGHSPPEVPGWASAVESIAGIPSTDDPNVHKILDGVHRSLDGCHFRVTSDKGVVKVSGRVTHELQKDVALQVVRSIDGVQSVEVTLDKF